MTYYEAFGLRILPLDGGKWDQIYEALPLIVFGIFLYFLPWFIATLRGHRNSTGVALLNFFLGWTCLGWLAALIWAVHRSKEDV